MVLVCSRCLHFNQFSVPLSLSNMNNVHNTFFVASLIYNVVQHFLSQLKKTLLSLPLAFNTSNALEYFNQRWKYPLFRPKRRSKFSISRHVCCSQASTWLSHMRNLIYCVTCGFWTNRQAWNEVPLNSSNSRGLHKRQSIFVRLSFYYPCYFRDKVCVDIKYVSKSVHSAGLLQKGMFSNNYA